MTSSTSGWGEAERSIKARTNRVEVVNLTFGTMTGGTTAFTANDVLIDTTIQSGIFAKNNSGGYLKALAVYDTDNQAQPMSVYFTHNSGSWAAENAAAAPSAAEVADIQGVVAVAGTHYQAPLGTEDMAYVSGLNIPLTPVSGTDDIYVAVVTTGTPTHTAGTANISMKAWFEFFDV